ncbi:MULTISPECIES: DUF4337 family protein [unclassified Novosphingobium]|uniref:DUF4337 family protein n=1 Tax=unclassified Novosphingobium TaxID=2644732 RepID=UPI00086DA3A6|nr:MULTISPECIES: DUF4337 family protein [unclassified Novosphingobium]MBN9144845.1 DUF4337 family protein [Novosphingobium sp.]MDR6708060.1 hypothetical protein [Novosphingobium sp. 1748]ODU82172.1 MAG: hypothetical protein ABT10_11510 [Novosphingobium sp. SCN 63-17]OJX92233.1 MAG: hypothetical protein BGP00_20410 [Novosphingobium sp. 63-713]
MTETKSSPLSVALIVLAVVLSGIIHIAMLSAQREGIQAALAAADATTMVEAMKARETMLIAQANQGGLDGDVRAGALGEAAVLRQGKLSAQPGGPRAPGIDAIATRIAGLRAEASSAAERSGQLGLAESALLLGILLLALSQIMAARLFLWLGAGLGLAGIALAALGVLGGVMA